MKVLIIICALFLAMPVPASAKNIKTQETREMKFVLVDAPTRAGKVTLKLSDGSTIVLSEQNGWQDRRMVLGSVKVEKVDGGSIDGSSTADEVRIKTETEQPSSVGHEKPKFKEVKFGTKWIWLAGGLLCIGAIVLIVLVRDK